MQAFQKNERELVSGTHGRRSRILSVAPPREVAFADVMKLGDLGNGHLDLIRALNPVTYASIRARQRDMGGTWRLSHGRMEVKPEWWGQKPRETWCQQSWGWPGVCSYLEPSEEHLSAGVLTLNFWSLEL